MEKLYFKRILLASAMFTGVTLFAQQTYSFTTCGASGSVGPTSQQVVNTYSSTNLAGQVTGSLGIQSWTVPTTGGYRIAAYGAQGGGSTGGTNTGSMGGFGAVMVGNFNFTAGQIIKILVGQEGGSTPYGGGGGGGSFVVDNSNNPLIIAGGGGGGNGYVGYSRGVFQGGCGVITTTGGNSNQTIGTYGSPVGSSRVDLQACKLEYSIVSPK